MRSLMTAAVLGASLLFAGTASANLSISKLWIEFKEGDQERNDIVIRNDSQDRYYVAVSVAEILDAGTEAEHKVSEADPERLGLLVTPNQLVLEPGAIRSIRLVSLNKALTQDRIYRVLIAPQVGTIRAKDVGAEARGVAIKMLAAYDVLVIDRPSTNAAVLQAQRFSDHVALTNSGNTNILVVDGYVCPNIVRSSPGTDKCKPLEAQRLYAGNMISVALDAPDDRIFIKTKTGPETSPTEREF
jgi:P pilus assembly chaperone PapD